jgi:hypothetical protein
MKHVAGVVALNLPDNFLNEKNLLKTKQTRKRYNI